MPNKLLLLVDGMALAYRAFHAIRELRTRDGVPTNALFGFIKMTRQLQELYRPTHEAVVFDGGLPAERMALLPSYKAQRPEMPEALASQLPMIEQFLDAARICRVRVEGEEADDAMATLVEAGRGEGFEVLMATSDKDMYQLVGPGVRVVSPVKDGPEMGEAGVLQKTGVRPDQMVDWLALTGDSVDNIPGVPGVGPKTAAKLLQEFGTLACVWERLDNVAPERLRENLRAHREHVERNVHLVSLRRDVPGVPPLAGLARRMPETRRLVGLLEGLEMNSLARSYGEAELPLF